MKSEKTKKIILTTLSVLSAFVVLRHEISNFHKTEWFIFDSFEIILWYGLGLLIAIPTIIISIKFARKTKSKTYYLPVVILVLATIVNLGLLTFGKTENNSPIILWANYDGDTNGLTLRLREDGTYKLENYSILGGDFTEGTYDIQNDTIYLDKEKPIGNDFMTGKLVLTPDKILFHLDNNGEYDTAFFSMRIIEKKIKKKNGD